MKILCDENVANSYFHALSNADGFSVRRSIDILDKEASDVRVSHYAAEHGYTLLTRDEGFFAEDPRHGIIYYPQDFNPRPPELVAAVRNIGEVHMSPAEIRCSLSNWID